LFNLLIKLPSWEASLGAATFSPADAAQRWRRHTSRQAARLRFHTYLYLFEHTHLTCSALPPKQQAG